jgi:hypothetical protein
MEPSGPLQACNGTGCFTFYLLLVNLLGRLRQYGDGSMTPGLIPINAIHRSRGRLGPEWCSREEICQEYRGRERNLSPHPVSVKPWLHSDIHTYLGSFFLDPRISRVVVWEPSETLAKEQDFLDLVSDYGAQTVHFKA